MILAYLFFLHLFADFVLQTREMGQKKGSSWAWLAAHICIIFAVFAVGGYWICSIKFHALNALFHAIIDASMWRLYAASVWARRANPIITREQLKSTWRYWDDHYFYLTIGVDQFLHYVTIVGVYGFIVK